ncbi:MAG: trigger factor [Actinobacteria bacterium]|nr:trigger factor [Actinomycetota bacterium]
MSTQVQELGENRVRLTVEVSPDQVKHAVEHALSDLAESVKIPGFRSGKIPQQVLVSRLGKDRIYREAVDSHIGGWFWSAASRNRVRPVAEPEYEFELPGTADDGWSFAATVEVQALPDIADWTQLQVPRVEADVPPESIDAELATLQESVAELAPAGGRPAREGDTLVVDLVDPAGEAQRDTVVELGASRLTGELEAALVGASAGEKKDVTFERGDGTSGTVEVTVREVQEKTLPPVDDELARAASEFDTLSELKESIESTLRAQLDEEIDAAYRVAAVDALVEESKVQPAPALVSSRAADLLTGFVRSLERRGVSLETYLAASGANPQEIQRQFVLEAAISIARELALEALAERAGIEVSDDEVKAYLRTEAQEAGEDGDALVGDVWTHGQQESIREDLRLRAALDRLVQDVTPITPDLAEARDKLWTPDKEKPEGETKLWIPGSKEPA